MRILVVVASVALLGTSARADDKPPERSADAAFLLPFSVTAVGVGLVAYGGDGSTSERVTLGIGVGALMVGPPLGRLYARDISWLGLGLEAGGLALALHGATSSDDGGLFGILAGTAVYGAGALYQIISAPIIVRRSNERRHTMLVPMPRRDGASVALVGAF